MHTVFRISILFLFDLFLFCDYYFLLFLIDFSSFFWFFLSYSNLFFFLFDLFLFAIIIILFLFLIDFSSFFWFFLSGPYIRTGPHFSCTGGESTAHARASILSWLGEIPQHGGGEDQVWAYQARAWTEIFVQKEPPTWDSNPGTFVHFDCTTTRLYGGL